MIGFEILNEYIKKVVAENGSQTKKKPALKT